jgi:hypothetical protein
VRIKHGSFRFGIVDNLDIFCGKKFGN